MKKHDLRAGDSYCNSIARKRLMEIIVEQKVLQNEIRRLGKMVKIAADDGLIIRMKGRITEMRKDLYKKEKYGNSLVSILKRNHWPPVK